MPRYNEFTLRAAGQQHVGTWYVEDGMLHVGSGFGSRSTEAPASTDDLEAIARAMLREIIFDRFGA